MSIYLGHGLVSPDTFTVTSEMVPPRSWNPSPLVEQAVSVRGYVDAVDLSDNLLAVARLSPVVGAFFIRQVGMEPIVQINLRDRNRMGIQSDLMGLAALGVKNITILGGYPAKIGTEPNAKEVYDLETMELVRYVRRFVDEGKLFDNTVMEEAPQMAIGVVENIAGKPVKELIDRLEAKVEAGANFVRTQLVFDLDLLGEWMEEARRRSLHERSYIMASILPLRDADHVDAALKIPGIVIPDEIIKRIKEANSPDIGMKMVVELIHKLRSINGVRGIHIRPLGGMDRFVSKIVREAGLMNRSLEAVQVS
jgi:methylenetetrahydrofolate reductase (NADPH)